MQNYETGVAAATTTSEVNRILWKKNSKVAWEERGGTELY